MYSPEQSNESFDDLERNVKKLSWMKLEDIKSYHDTLFQKDVVGELPGAQIDFQSICSTGSSENWFGVGKTDISLHRPGSKYPWVDLLDIGYSNPTDNQLLYAQTSPALSVIDGSDIFRRVSRKQADAIKQVIMKALDKEFNGVIPADDDL